MANQESQACIVKIGFLLTGGQRNPRGGLAISTENSLRQPKMVFSKYRSEERLLFWNSGLPNRNGHPDPRSTHYNNYIIIIILLL